MSISQAIESIRRCEAELQSILKDAATRGDYESLIRVGEWAKRIASISSQGTQEKPDVLPMADKFSAPSADSDRPRPTGLPSSARAIAQSNQPVPRKKTRGKRTKGKSKYPKFAKRSDQLIKIGWSKKEKKEYQHKAPKHVAELLASTLSKTAKSVKVITTDDIFPLAEDDGTEVPSYQSYLCLAWFRHEEAITQNGRQGYHVHDPDRLISIVIEKWKGLPNI